MIGKRFGRLLVIGFAYSKNAAYWDCACDCGGRNTVRAALLRNGTVASCGCGSLEAARANLKASAIKSRSKYWPHTRTFKDTRRNMIRRCHDPRDRRYGDYGARGIRVCADWRSSPSSFYDWLILNGWQPGLSVERVNVHGGYCPENCILIPLERQASNTRRNHFVEWNGERKTVSDWARTIGVEVGALQHRFTRGWPVERAMSQPFRNWP